MYRRLRASPPEIPHERNPCGSPGEPPWRYAGAMGNPVTPKSRQSGPCSTCNANGGRWHGEEGTVHCLNPYAAGRHVIRGAQASTWSNNCWQPVTAPLPLDAVKELVLKAKRRR